MGNNELQAEILRLEQENNSLQAQLNNITVQSNNKITALKQENEQLKNKNICREPCEYFKRICNENTLLIKYRSALEKIKKDLKEICKEECDYTKPKFCGDCDCRYGQILNKIKRF